jgi:hypothetical protein
MALNTLGSFGLIIDNYCMYHIDTLKEEIIFVAGKCDEKGNVDGTGENARIGNKCTSIAIDPLSEAFALFTDTEYHVVKKVVISTGYVTSISGTSGSAGDADGDPASAKFKDPLTLAIDPTGTYALIVDNGNKKIKKLVIDTGVTTTIATIAD